MSSDVRPVRMMTGMHHDRLLSCEAFFKDAPFIISWARD
jgi:hypothetical protein